MTDVTNRPTERERQASELADLKGATQRLRAALATIFGQASAFKRLNPLAADSVTEIEAAKATGLQIRDTALAAINAILPHVHARIQHSDDADTCAHCGLDLRDREKIIRSYLRANR